MKYKRQAHIIKIVKENNVKTQDELIELLKKDGTHATQATVSRDIKELGLIRVNTKDGSKYDVRDNATIQSDRLMVIFSQSVLSINIASNIVVVKTMPGMAQAAASAVDSANISEIVGCIAGDDTIFIATANEYNANKCAGRLRGFTNNK